MKLTLAGTTSSVTSSKYLLEADGDLVDCGLYQGMKRLRLRNWKPLPVEPESISAVLLTHTHIDHSGFLPVLVRNGFKGRVFCTPPTHCGKRSRTRLVVQRRCLSTSTWRSRRALELARHSSRMT